MFNAVNKSSFMAALAAGLLLSSCGKGHSPEALAIREAIDEAINQERFAQAVELMDSLNSAYPEEIELRTEVLKLRPSVMEGYTISEIAIADSALAATEMSIEQLSPSFEHIENKALVENYYVAKNGKVKNLMNATAVEARLDEDFTFYVIASLQGKNIGLNSISLEVGGETASTNVIPEGDERAISGVTGQKAVFSGPDAEEIGILASSHRDSASKITFNGRSGSKTIDLTPEQTAAIGDTYLYSKALQDLRLGRIRREKLERQLQISRNQKANISE